MVTKIDTIKVKNNKTLEYFVLDRDNPIYMKSK